MRELNLQVENSKYNQFVPFLTTIDYVKILTQRQQTSKKPKLSSLRKNIISPQAEQSI